MNFNYYSLLFALLMSYSVHANLKSLNQMESPFELGILPLAANSLEPLIDKETMLIHHDQIHQDHVTLLNENLKENDVTILDIFLSASQRTEPVRNNAGGHWNHTFLWSVLSRESDKHTMPSQMQKEIEASFGTVKKFKAEFEAAGMEQFGAGWVWLIRNAEGNLQITSTPNQDNPLMNDAISRGYPILGADLWEHAYYRKYQNKRSEYLKNFWTVVNWKKVHQLFNEAKHLKLPE